MADPLFRITIEGTGDTDGDEQPEVVFDADFLGMDIVRFKQNVSVGDALSLFKSLITSARKALKF